MHISRNNIRPTKGFNTQIEIIDFESLHARKDNQEYTPDKPHRVEFNLLIFFESGSGSHFVDFTNQPFNPGDILLIQKNQIHAFDLTSQARGKIVLFSDQYMLQVLDNARLPLLSSSYLDAEHSAIIKLNSDTLQSFLLLLKEMQKELQANAVDSLIANHLFASLLLTLNRAVGNQHDTSAEQFKDNQLFAFYALLESQQVNSRNAADYAEHLPVTYKTLNQHCKALTGKTAKQIIDLHLVLEIRRRLVIEDKSIQSISNDLGFDEVTNFVKYFKKHTGTTPNEFRKTPKVRYLPY